MSNGHMEESGAPAAAANGNDGPKVAIKGADGGTVQSEAATKTQPQQASMDTPFRPAATAEVHQSTGPAVPEGNEEARRSMEAQKSQQPWAKGMSDTAMHTPLQRNSDQTSKDLGPSEAGHKRRWVKVPKGWYAKKGNFVMENLYVGDALGKGMQVGVPADTYSIS